MQSTSIDTLQRNKIWQMKFSRINKELVEARAEIVLLKKQACDALVEARVEIGVLKQELSKEQALRLACTKETRQMLTTLLESHLSQ